MFENRTEKEAREEILEMVEAYCSRYHNQKKEFHEGQRIPYASRVYDSREMTNLVDSALEFWLTAGRYTDQFEKKLAEYLGVKFCSLVNSGSSANLNAFMALTSPLLGDRRIRRGDEVITVAAGFPTTVTPMIQYGAVPVFVDVTIPEAPQVTPEEGSYTRPTLITVKGGENCRIYYTQDGSAPTQDSAEYTAPFPMPIGQVMGTHWSFSTDSI